jgi:hypothetical protein
VLSLDILQLLESVGSGENLDRVDVRLERVRISLLLDLPHELHEVLFREGGKRGRQQFTAAACVPPFTDAALRVVKTN